MLDRAMLANMAAANAALDDMDAVSGISIPGGRFPVAAIAATMKGPDVSVSHSTVGVLNTGQGARISANVKIAQTADANGAIFELAKAVAQSAEMQDETKMEVVELLRALQAPGQPKSVALAILQRVEAYVRPIASIFALYTGVAHFFTPAPQPPG